ncbi:MAG: NAD-binding protein [Pseudomonadota bacterium]
MVIKKRLLLVVLAIVLVVLFGTFGYYFLFHGAYSILDCLYMTVISITSVGYGEILLVTGNPAAELFTMVLIVVGIGIITYGIGTLTAVLIEGELSGILRMKQMKKAIDKLENHYIVCGGGETGLPVIEELVKNKEHVVLVESNQENIDRCCKVIEDLLYVLGDATEDEHLISAGIARAKGVAICLPSDKDNLYVTMTARMLNRKLRIISRMVNVKLKAKLKKAGADSVVSPNSIGALRIASEMIRPTVVNFLDSMLRSKRGNLRIHQIVVGSNSPMVGVAMKDSGLKSQYRLLVLGAQEEERDIEFNPDPMTPLRSGMTLIVMGDMEDIARATAVF